MTRPVIELQSPGPLTNTLTSMPMGRFKHTVVEDDPKALFSVATTPSCWGHHDVFPLIAPLNPWYVCHVVCHWEERNKKFPLPHRVWINRPQRLTVKRGIKNVGQLLGLLVNWRWRIQVRMKARSGLHSVTGWTEKGHRGQYSSPNELHDRVRKKKEAKWLARTLEPEVAPFSSEEIGIKNSVLGRRSPWEDGWSDATTPGEGAERSFRTAVGVTRCIETVAETPGKKRKKIWTRT